MKHRELLDLSERLCEIGDIDLMGRFLEEILTPAELDAVVSRWTICRLLLEGVSQREISRRLGVSLCKITRGARELKNEESVIRSLLEGEVVEEVENSEPVKKASAKKAPAKKPTPKRTAPKKSAAKERAAKRPAVKAAAAKQPDAKKRAAKKLTAKEPKPRQRKN